MGLDSCRISRDSTEHDATSQRVGQEHRCNNRLTLMRRLLGLFVGLQMVLIEYHMSLSCNTPLWPDQTQTQICKGFVCLQLLDEHGHPRDFAPAKDWWNITGQSAHKWAAWIKTAENPWWRPWIAVIPNGITAELTGFAALLFITYVLWCHSVNLCRIRKPNLAAYCMLLERAETGLPTFAYECIHEHPKPGAKHCLKPFIFHTSSYCESLAHGSLTTSSNIFTRCLWPIETSHQSRSPYSTCSAFIRLSEARQVLVLEHFPNRTSISKDNNHKIN